MKIIFIKVHPPFLVLPEVNWLKREYRMRWMLRQTKELGHETSLFLLSNCDSVYEYREDSAPIMFFRVDKLKDSKDCHTSKIMLNKLEEEHPDVLVFKGFEYKLTSFIIENLSYRPKIVYIAGGRIRDKYLSEVDWIFAETEEQEKLFLKSNKNVSVLPKTVDTEIFNLQEKKEFDIVNVGNFDVRKNQMCLTSFFSSYKCVLVGNGINYPKVKMHANNFSNVLMPGDVSTDEVANYIKKSKVMVHPSTFEGYPRAIIESMACGVPVVAFRKTIGDGILKDSKHGFLVEDELEMMIKTEYLLEKDDIRKEMGDECRKLVLENYGKEVTKPILKDLFERL